MMRSLVKDEPTYRDGRSNKRRIFSLNFNANERTGRCSLHDIQTSSTSNKGLFIRILRGESATKIKMALCYAICMQMRHTFQADAYLIGIWSELGIQKKANLSSQHLKRVTFCKKNNDCQFNTRVLHLTWQLSPENGLRTGILFNVCIWTFKNQASLGYL